MSIIPKEEDEWKILAEWLRLNNYKSTHIANEIWVSGFVWMMVNKKKVAQGLNKWFPDYCIILKRWALLFLELKRQKRILKSWKFWASPSKISEEQIKWIEELEKLENVAAEICYWAEDWIRIIEEYEKI